METQKQPSEVYSLGHSSKEIKRLEKQSQLTNPFTQHLLAEAGIATGMRVLDIGCGPGDVSLIAAKLVGEAGSVLGVDTNAAALKVARERTDIAGLGNASFLAGDIREMAFDQDFDAIVGRLILEHVPAHTAILRRLTQRLRPGGVVAFQEFDMSGPIYATMPASHLWEQAWNWIMHAFQQAGVETRMGMHLYSTFLEAGLPAPHLRCEAAIGAGPEWVGYEVMAETVRALLPLILKSGAATEEEVGIVTLEDRLRDEIVSQRGVARFPALVSAWVRKQ